MVRGRKKKTYRSAVKSVNISDLTAWEICKKKGINISEEVTRYIQFMAYSHRVQDTADGLERARIITLEKMQAMEIARDKEMLEIEKKYEGLLKATAAQVNKITDLQKTKELERVITAKIIAK